MSEKISNGVMIKNTETSALHAGLKVWVGPNETEDGKKKNWGVQNIFCYYCLEKNHLFVDEHHSSIFLDYGGYVVLSVDIV
jgi:hypothetical protein